MKFIVEEKMRLDHFVMANMSELSRSKILKLIKVGKIVVNGTPVKQGTRLQKGDVVKINDDFKETIESKLEARDIDFDVAFENDHFAIIDKPAGLTVHPGNDANDQDTLAHGLLHRFEQLSSISGEDRPGIVHRLDKATSGLMVIAKNDEAHIELKKLFQDRLIDKTYVVLIFGHIPQDDGIIEAPIARSNTNRTKMCIAADGRDSTTHFSVIDRIGDYCLVEAKLITGRTHQIRVHFSSLKFPVAGDAKYASRKQNARMEKDGISRLFLHSHKLSFDFRGERYEFSSPLPASLEDILTQLKRKR